MLQPRVVGQIQQLVYLQHLALRLHLLQEEEVVVVVATAEVCSYAAGPKINVSVTIACQSPLGCNIEVVHTAMAHPEHIFIL